MKGWFSTAVMAQGGCGAFILGYVQKSIGHGPGQPAVAGTTLRRGNGAGEFLWYLPASAVLGFCDHGEA